MCVNDTPNSNRDKKTMTNDNEYGKNGMDDWFHVLDENNLSLMYASNK